MVRWHCWSCVAAGTEYLLLAITFQVWERSFLMCQSAVSPAGIRAELLVDNFLRVVFRKDFQKLVVYLESVCSSTRSTSRSFIASNLAVPNWSASNALLWTAGSLAALPASLQPHSCQRLAEHALSQIG